MPMFKLTKNFDSEKFYYGISSVLPKILSVVFIPLILRLITPTNWGKISLLLIFQQIFVIVFNHGLSTNLFKNYSKDQLSKKILLSVILEIFSCFILIASVILFFDISSLINLSNNPIMWMLSASFFQAINVVLKAVARILEKPKMFLNIIFSERVAVISMQFLFVYREVLIIGYDSTGIASSYFIGSFIGSFFIFLVFGSLIFSRIKKINTGKKLVRSKKLLSAVTISSFSFFLISWFDRFVILEFLEFYDLGIYSAYDALARILRISIEGFLFLYTSKIFKDKNSNDLKKFRSQIINLSFYLLILGILLADFFIGFILLDSYTSYADLVFPLGLSYFFLVYVSLFQNHMIVEDKYNNIVFATFLSCLLNIVLNYFLVPTFGIYGASYSTLISVACIALTYIYYSKYYKEVYLIKFLYMFLTMLLLFLVFNIESLYLSIFKTIVFIYFLYKTYLTLKSILLKN